VALGDIVRRKLSLARAAKILEGEFHNGVIYGRRNAFSREGFPDFLHNFRDRG